MLLVTANSYGCTKKVAGNCNFSKLYKMMHITASSIWLSTHEPQKQNYLTPSVIAGQLQRGRNLYY
uniref:Uncharacterized protein n=1 Tax=Oryza glumipatula TaxID=40148 RepID=A0A0D9Z1I7_9ORYZ